MEYVQKAKPTNLTYSSKFKYRKCIIPNTANNKRTLQIRPIQLQKQRLEIIIKYSRLIGIHAPPPPPDP